MRRCRQGRWRRREGTRWRSTTWTTKSHGRVWQWRSSIAPSVRPSSSPSSSASSPSPRPYPLSRSSGGPSLSPPAVVSCGPFGLAALLSVKTDSLLLSASSSSNLLDFFPVFYLSLPLFIFLCIIILFLLPPKESRIKRCLLSINHNELKQRVFTPLMCFPPPICHSRLTYVHHSLSTSSLPVP